MANNYLITGYWGEPHVTAENDRGLNAAIFGAGRFVLPVGRQLQAEFIGNGTVRLYDGKLLDNGALGGIPAGKYVDLLIPEAGQNEKRNDLIVFQYSKDASTLVEFGEFVVIRGDATGGVPADPVLQQQDLLTDEATFDQFPLYRISVTGATIGTPVPMFELSRNFDGVAPVAHNLLDNSDFTNPVNTNGQTVYRGLGYGIDRWVVPNDTSAMTIGDGFVLLQNDDTTASSTFVNRLRAGTLKAGKKYTGVIGLADGTVIFGCGTCTGDGASLIPSANDVYLRVMTGASYDSARLVVNAGKSARIAYVALYEGEYDRHTLPKYIPKGRATEVLSCYIAEFGDMGTKVLWENPAPSINFVSQQVAVDLSLYKGVFISYATTPGADTNVSTGLIPVNDKYHVTQYFTTAGTQTRRAAKANVSGIYINGGNQGGTANDGVLIPMQIVGIK